MSTKYVKAPSVAAIAKRLIGQYHTHLSQLDIRVEYVFRLDVPMKGGHEIWATARKISGLNAFLAGEVREDGGIDEAFFCIVVSQPIWAELDAKQREALVDHELSHCWAEKDDEGVIQLRLLGHDLEEFAAVVQRHGNWRRGIEQFLRAAKRHQSCLDFEEEAVVASVTIDGPIEEALATIHRAKEAVTRRGRK